jgi:hypothetical protein
MANSAKRTGKSGAKPRRSRRYRSKRKPKVQDATAQTAPPPLPRHLTEAGLLKAEEDRRRMLAALEAMEILAPETGDIDAWEAEVTIVDGPPASAGDGDRDAAIVAPVVKSDDRMFGSLRDRLARALAELGPGAASPPSHQPAHFGPIEEAEVEIFEVAPASPKGQRPPRLPEGYRICED